MQFYDFFLLNYRSVQLRLYSKTIANRSTNILAQKCAKEFEYVLTLCTTHIHAFQNNQTSFFGSCGSHVSLSIRLSYVTGQPIVATTTKHLFFE